MAPTGIALAMTGPGWRSDLPPQRNAIVGIGPESTAVAKWGCQRDRRGPGRKSAMQFASFDLAEAAHCYLVLYNDVADFANRPRHISRQVQQKHPELDGEFLLQLVKQAT